MKNPIKTFLGRLQLCSGLLAVMFAFAPHESAAAYSEEICCFEVFAEFDQRTLRYNPKFQGDVYGWKHFCEDIAADYRKVIEALQTNNCLNSVGQHVPCYTSIVERLRLFLRRSLTNPADLKVVIATNSFCEIGRGRERGSSGSIGIDSTVEDDRTSKTKMEFDALQDLNLDKASPAK